MTPPDAATPGRRMHLGELMALVAGLAVGIWLVLPPGGRVPQMGLLEGGLLLGIAGVLGGLSLVGPPLLLRDRLRRRRGARPGPWGAGRLLWFSSGTSAWLLWPPIVSRRALGGAFNDSESAVCFAYGTPLMALYVVAALSAGGWLRRSRRRRMRRDWRERFGLLLGLLWACTGLYVLAMLYGEDLGP
jgi:hypothetical protein